MRCLSGKLRWEAGAAALLLAGLWGGPEPISAAQQQPMQTVPPAEGQPAEPDDNPMRRAQVEKQTLARESDRQKRLVEDSNRLLELAKELKAEVDKSDKNTLSVNVVKKAGEIEKLAKSIKDRMRGQD